MANEATGGARGQSRGANQFRMARAAQPPAALPPPPQQRRGVLAEEGEGSGDNGPPARGALQTLTQETLNQMMKTAVEAAVAKVVQATNSRCVCVCVCVGVVGFPQYPTPNPP